MHCAVGGQWRESSLEECRFLGWGMISFMVASRDVIQAVEGWVCEERAYLSCYERAQAKALLHWLKRYRPKADATNLQRVQGWLESIHYLTALDNYGLAYEVMQVQPEMTATDGKPLHELLGRWGYSAERLALYESLLGQVPVEHEVVLIDGMAHTQHSLGNYDEVLRRCRQYQEALIQLQDPRQAQKAEGRLYGLLGITHHAKGDYLQAVEAHRRRLELGREVADWQVQADALGDLGIVHFSMGAFAEAIACHEEQLKLCLQAQDEARQIMALGSLGHVALALGQVEVARERYERLSGLAQQRGDRMAECGALMGLGNIARGEGQL
ncbi:MAG: tetratricopeptide repeat protein, partial [Cyanobacteria bacterium J06643_4]